MANFVNIELQTGKALERALKERLEVLLGSIPWLKERKVEIESGAQDRGYDILATFSNPAGGKVTLCVECKSVMRPRTFRFVATKMFHPPGRPKVIIPVLDMPWVPPGVAEACQANQWSWFDLAGNHFLEIPGVLRLSHTGNEPSHGRPRPAANLGTAEAARILRALLMGSPIGKRWTQHALRDACRPEVSIGLVNKIVRHLRDEDWLEPGDDAGFRIRDPLKLLFAWRDAYRFDRHPRLNYFLLDQGKVLQTTLAKLDPSKKGISAYAAFSAAELQAPHVRQPKTWIYVRVTDLDRVETLTGAKQVDSGENLIVLVPEDEGVFAGMEGSEKSGDRLGCTHPVQTYVDLHHAGGRGAEAAEALLEQRIKPAWIKQGLKV
jgi:hypothetical protein